MRKTYNFSIALQFEETDVPKTKRTLTILMKHIDGKTLKDCLEEDLLSFVETHDRWCRDISSFYLKHHKKVKFDEYAEDFPFFALDSLGITLWARCYRKHVGIVCNHRFWCTRSDQDFDKCDIILVYNGKGEFEDTRVMEADECKDLGGILAKVQAVMDERDLKENTSRVGRRRTRQQKQKIYSSDSEDNLDLEEVLESGKRKPNKMRKKDDTPPENPDENADTPDVSEKQQENDETENNMQKNEDTVTAEPNIESENNIQKTQETPPDVNDQDGTENNNQKQEEVTEKNVQKGCSVQITSEDVSNILEYLEAEKNAEKEHGKGRSANKMPKKK